REFRGGADMHYRLRLGDIAVATSIFPLGVQRGTEAAIHVKGVFLAKNLSSSGKENWLDGKKVKVTIPKDAAPGSKVAVPLTTPLGKLLGNPEVVVGEFPEFLATAPAKGGFEGAISVPGTGNGYLHQPGQQ